MFLQRPNMRKVSAAVFMFFKRCWSVKHEVRAGVFHLHSFLNQLLTSVSFSLSVNQDWSRIFCRRCSFRFHFRLNKCTGKKKFSLCISNNSRGICRGIQWDLEKLFFRSSYELMTPKLSRIFCRGGWDPSQLLCAMRRHPAVSSQSYEFTSASVLFELPWLQVTRFDPRQ